MLLSICGACYIISLATYGPGTAIKSELFKREVAKRRANSAVRAPRAREARGTALRRAELGCGRSPHYWFTKVVYEIGFQAKRR